MGRPGVVGNAAVEEAAALGLVVVTVPLGTTTLNQESPPRDDSAEMNGPDPHNRSPRWLTLLMPLPVIAAVVYWMTVRSHLLAAFGVAAILTLGLGVFGLARSGTVEFGRLRARGVIAVVIWCLAVSAFIWLASSWDDFGTP
jgi:hypothetical protein